MQDWKREMCERNGHEWVLSHSTYKTANGEVNNRGIHKEIPEFFVEDSQRRGFLLISPMGALEREEDYGEEEGEAGVRAPQWFALYFALVDSNHRRQGVLRAMIDEVRTRLPSGSILWLECRADTAPCWAALNFSPASYDPGFIRTCDCAFKLVI